MVRVYKAELDALIQASAKVSHDLARIVEAVRVGRADAEVEIAETILAINALTSHLRVLRKRETPSPIPPTPASSDPVTPRGNA